MNKQQAESKLNAALVKRAQARNALAKAQLKCDAAEVAADIAADAYLEFLKVEALNK